MSGINTNLPQQYISTTVEKPVEKVADNSLYGDQLVVQPTVSSDKVKSSVSHDPRQDTLQFTKDPESNLVMTFIRNQETGKVEQEPTEAYRKYMIDRHQAERQAEIQHAKLKAQVAVTA